MILFDNVHANGPIVVVFRNNDGSGGQYLTNGEIVEIGEICVSESFDLPIKRTPKISRALINKQRFTTNGNSVPIIQPQIRTLPFDLKPLPQVESINSGTDDVAAVMDKIMRGNVAIFVPFPTVDPSYYGPDSYSSTASQEIRAKTSMLASFNQPPSMSMDGDYFWNTTVSVTESI